MNANHCGTCRQTHQECARTRPQYADVESCCCDQPATVRASDTLPSYALRQKIQPGATYEAIIRDDAALVDNGNGHAVCLWLGSEAELVPA